MTTAIIDDFSEIASALKRIEEAKKPAAEKPTPDPTEVYDLNLYGCLDFMG